MPKKAQAQAKLGNPASRVLPASPANPASRVLPVSPANPASRVLPVSPASRVLLASPANPASRVLLASLALPHAKAARPVNHAKVVSPVKVVPTAAVAGQPVPPPAVPAHPNR